MNQASPLSFSDIVLHYSVVAFKDLQVGEFFFFISQLKTMTTNVWLCEKITSSRYGYKFCTVEGLTRLSSSEDIDRDLYVVRADDTRQPMKKSCKIKNQVEII